PQASMHAFDRALRSAYSEVLIDDLAILQQVCAEQSSASAKAITEAIASIKLLPARATLRDFLADTAEAFHALGWGGRWMEIPRRVDQRLIDFAAPMSRTLYLRWLDEIASTATKAREVAGEHPYARVQSVTVPEAQGQEWSHLIFAGWNEGSWPPPTSGEFVRDEEIAAFNGGIRNLNRRAATQGQQGEGHDAVRDGHAFFVGPAEERQIALRQFESLVHSAAAEIAFSANLAQENAPERFWNPSELLTQVYQHTHQKPLTHSTMSGLQRATAAWLQSARSLTSKGELPSVQIEQTRVAYDSRRDPEQPAGEFDFAFRAPPARVPVFSVSDLEKLVSQPALIWLKKYLGVEAAAETGSPWSAATGMWVHHWLANIASEEGAETFVRVPTASEIDGRIRTGAEQKMADVKRLCAAAGKPLPDWWSSGWQNALCLARHLGAKLATMQEWQWMATEQKIDVDECIALSNDRTLSFRGRMDLLLAREEPSSGHPPTELWVVDYKTGATKPLAAARDDAEKRSTRLHNRLVKGEALQLGLYSLAVRERGADEVFLSIVSSAVRAVEPQLAASDIGAHLDVFEELARMQQEGIFGMYGPLRSPFGYSRPYPLATVAIDPDLLDARWELTHPALAREEEDWEP
ncbi:MAG: PD-(D/E)XK nuclease family protein, partial [Verrucomicrobiota bacterium]|nr:PD-(D/E)XK nuclease family protein [Verrucomicrobiota bacterium]